MEPNIHRWWREKDWCLPFIFPHVLEIAQPDYTRRDSTALGVKGTLSRIDRIFFNLPMAEARDFHCYSMSSRTWGTGPFRVITRRCVLSLISQPIGCNRANAFQVGCPNIPFSAPFCNDLTMTTVFLLIRLVRSQNSKFFLKRLRVWRSVNSLGRHLTAAGRSS